MWNEFVFSIQFDWGAFLWFVYIWVFKQTSCVNGQGQRWRQMRSALSLTVLAKFSGRHFHSKKIISSGTSTKLIFVNYLAWSSWNAEINSGANDTTWATSNSICSIYRISKHSVIYLKHKLRTHSRHLIAVVACEYSQVVVQSTLTILSCNTRQADGFLHPLDHLIPTMFKQVWTSYFVINSNEHDLLSTTRRQRHIIAV